MKKNIGAVSALSPTPTIVVGCLVEGKINWTLTARTGIIGNDCILFGIRKDKHSDIGIRKTGKLSVNIVVDDLLLKADYVGYADRSKTDKSTVFRYTMINEDVPLIDASPVSMVCSVMDNYETEAFDNFVCRILKTHVDETFLNKDERIDYRGLRPILFEMPGGSYLKTGDTITKCGTWGREYMKNIL